MALDRADVEHIAILARLGLTDEEVETLGEQLSNILEQFEILRQLDTTGVAPTGHAVELAAVLRDDAAAGSLEPEEVLSNAPRREGGVFPGEAGPGGIGPLNQLWQLTLHEAHQRLARREISSLELTRACLERIHQVEDRVKSFVTVTEEVALEQAERADRRIVAGEGGPLTGIPVQIKDLMCTRGIPTTCSSRMLQNYVPVYDATVVARLFDQGAVLLGKGNMDEFAMGSSCENSAFFPTHNPWDLERVPGGSSGGAAASVAAGEAVYSLGSDTGGSIRQPASLCGVVGLKPTYGLVSRYGLVAFASSLDQIGPLTQDVTDCALVLNGIAGYDPRDSTSIPQEGKDYTAALTGQVKGLRLGIPDEYFVEGMQEGVREGVLAAVKTLEGLGASIEPVSFAHHPVRFGLLLHHRPVGMLGQPGPLRRGEVRLFLPGYRQYVGGHGKD